MLSVKRSKCSPSGSESFVSHGVTVPSTGGGDTAVGQEDEVFSVKKIKCCL